jgi:citronellol/citronellal dehydrogenase
MTLAGKTLLISGGSRGIGLAIATRAARDGANVALIAKTAEPHRELYADAAYAVIAKPSRECTGNALLCEDVLAADGVTDFGQYAYHPGTEPGADLFVDHV